MLVAHVAYYPYGDLSAVYIFTEVEYINLYREGLTLEGGSEANVHHALMPCAFIPYTGQDGIHAVGG